MILISSANGDVGMQAGIDILRSGGSAIDAVEAACRLVEDNLDDHSVGTGGYPNLRGEVELDAAIMEGTSRRAGAVAAITDYPNPISVARAVMDRLPQHVLLVGAGASEFAAEMGFVKRALLTEESEAAFRRRTITLYGEEYSFNGSVLAKSNGDGAHVDCAPNGLPTPAELVAGLADPAKTYGTVNFLAIDSENRIASATSTSGWAFKYPGRTGDTPLIGAGNYCDDRFGACACTGLGEWAIRASTARAVVLTMQLGMGLNEACRFAMDDLASIPIAAPIEPVMNLVALDRAGNHAAYATMPGRTYIWQKPDMKSFETCERVLRPVEAPWR